MTLSTATRSLIWVLYQPPSLADRFLRRDAKRIATLRAIGESGEVLALPYLLRCLLDGSPRETTAAANAGKELLARATDTDLVELDAELRREWDERYYTPWFGLRPADLSDAATPAADVLRKLGSFHPNGFVRERAIEQMKHVHDASNVPFLLLRVNDWVPEVRTAARTALDQYLNPQDGVYYLKSLALLARLQAAGRADHVELLTVISNLFSETAPGLEAVFQTLLNGAPKTKRALLGLLGLSDHSEATVPFALATHDPLLRLWAIRRAPNVFADDALLAALREATGDGSNSVRHEATLLLMTRFPDQARDLLHAALMDRSPSIRDLARFHLAQSGFGSFAAFYRAAVRTEKDSRLDVAVAGLGEAGEPRDAEVVAAFLQHQRVRIRKAAVAAVARLGAVRFLNELVHSLHDPSPGVSRAARRALRAHVSELGADTLWTSFESSRQPHTQRNLVELIAALSKWDSLPLLLRIAVSADRELSLRAADHLRRWNLRYNQTAILPTPYQHRVASGALKKAAATLDPHLVSELRFVLDSVPVDLR